jgi:hypothetical protein
LPEWIRESYRQLNNPSSIESCLTPEGIEDVIINSEEIMIQVINNVDCCCQGGSTSPTTLYCVADDGTVTYTPVSPQDPTPKPPGDLTFPFDPETDTPPFDIENWDAYDTAFCAFSNGIFFAVRAFLQTAETIIDIVAAGAALAVILAPLLPSGVLAAIGGATFLDVVWQLVQIITSEQASNILNEMVDWMNENREDIICAIFSHRYDWGELGVQLSQDAADYVELTLTLSAEERNAVQNVMARLFGWQIAAGAIAGELGVFGDVGETVDCATCGQLGFAWTENSASDFCTIVPMSLVVDGQTVTYDGEISKSGQYGSYEWVATASNEANSIEEMSGLQVTFTNVSQGQSKPIIVTIHYGTGQYLQQVIDPGNNYEFDCSAIEVTSVEVKVQIGAYNLSCPQAISGEFSWEVI